MALPPLTPEQRAEALKKAAEARRERAAIKARLKDSAGHVGVGEVPGGEAIRQTLDDARALLVGEPIGQYNALLGKVRRSTSAMNADRKSVV